MKILKINNQYSCELSPSITAVSGEWWFLNNKLHRVAKPAVKTNYTELYYHRGIKISKDVVEGKLSAEEILKIDNMEVRQSAMEILGYEQFFKCAEEIDRFTPEDYKIIYPEKTDPMYSLYVLKTQRNELNDPIKLLMMIDPSKRPLIKYFIRVHPDETKCGDAVAHSYGMRTWGEFADNKIWV